MNKESIYRIIGYNGEYSSNVKKAIRKLLKENHPDNNGDRKIFELINEVKKELEENRVSFDYKSNKNTVKKSDDIDYLYCSKMLNNIIKEKSLYEKKLKIKKKELSSFIREYNSIYQSSIDLETNLLSNSYYIDKLKKTKISCIILLLLAVITFIASVITKNIVILSLFILLSFTCVIIIHNAFFMMQKITDFNRNKINNYVGINSKIHNNQNSQKELKKEIYALTKKVNNLNNDIRFYENLIKNR